MTDDTEPRGPADPLHAAVTALQGDVTVRPGLSDRMRARARQQTTTRRWLSGSAGAFAMLLVTALLTHKATPLPGEITFAVHTNSDEGVSLVGDFTAWETDRVRMTPHGDHEWKVTLRLPPGRYRFAYVTDNGDWLPDAKAAPVIDDFGRPTSVLTVTNQ